MVGAVVKIDVSDLHIPSNVASGMNVNSQLSFTIGLENCNQVDTLGVQITTILVYDGLMSVQNGSMATQVGIISANDVIETRADRSNYVDWSSAHSIYAGGMMGKLGHYASMGKKGLDALCSVKEMFGKGGRCAKGSKKVDIQGCLKRAPKGKGGELLTRGELRARMFE
jgi:hypothetical protein